MSTESRSTFVWNQPGTAASSRSYRGNAPVSNPLSMSQQTIHSELQGLGARLAALDAASKAAAPAAESAAQVTRCVLFSRTAQESTLRKEKGTIKQA